MSIKRYNQGFIKFGLMEQCNDGKWIEYSEHRKELISVSNAERQSLLTRVYGVQDRLAAAEDKLEKSETVIAVLLGTTLGLLIALIYTCGKLL